MLGPSEDETVGLLLHYSDDHQGLAEVALGMPRRMSQGHVHFSGQAAVLANVFLNDGIPTEEVILVSEPFEDVFCGEALLSGKLEILSKMRSMTPVSLPPWRRPQVRTRVHQDSLTGNVFRTLQ